MNEQTEVRMGEVMDMVKTNVQYDENGNPIVTQEDSEVVREVFVQPEEAIN